MPVSYWPDFSVTSYWPDFTVSKCPFVSPVSNRPAESMVWKPADLRPESNEVEPAGEKRQKSVGQKIFSPMQDENMFWPFLYCHCVFSKIERRLLPYFTVCFKSYIILVCVRVWVELSRNQLLSSVTRSMQRNTTWGTQTEAILNHIRLSRQTTCLCMLGMCCYSCKGIPDWEATVMVLVSTVAFLGTGRVMEALEERVGLTLQERPFRSFFTSSSSVPVQPNTHKQCSTSTILSKSRLERALYSLLNYTACNFFKKFRLDSTDWKLLSFKFMFFRLIVSVLVHRLCYRK